MAEPPPPPHQPRFRGPPPPPSKAFRGPLPPPLTLMLNVVLDHFKMI